MKCDTSTLITAAAFLVAFGFTAAQAEPQPGMSPSGGPTGNIGAGEGGAMAPSTPEGGLNQPGNAGPKGSTAGTPSTDRDATMAPKGTAEDQTNQMGGQKDGSQSDRKSGSAAEGPADTKGGMPKDDKSGATAEGKDDTKGGMSKDDKSGATAEGKDDTKGAMSKDDKSGATAEGKGDAKAKTGKSARLESNDVSKVRTHFSKNRPNAKRINRNDVSVSIGFALPGAIALYDLPADVIVVSGPCPVQYFVWDDDIVLVDSCSREVVEIIADVG